MAHVSQEHVTVHRAIQQPRGTQAIVAQCRDEGGALPVTMEQQARNLVYDLAERGEKASYLIRDGDTKFTQKFDEIFKSEGIKVKKLPYRSPNLNAFAERFVQSIKQECLDHFVVFGEHHLDHLIREYERHYNTVRPHQGLGNATIPAPPPPTEVPLDPSEIECDSRLGGLLRHYYRRAA